MAATLRQAKTLAPLAQTRAQSGWRRMTATKRIVLAGGSGFLGTILAESLAGRGWTPVILTRQPNRANRWREVAWDARTLGPWTEELEGASAVLNLAGRSVNCRFTEKNKRLVMDSRVNSTRILGKALARCANPPAAWLNSSTATIYRHTFGTPHDESSHDFAPSPEAKDEYSVAVARAWEDAFDSASTPGTRKVALRTTLVFGSVPGGVFRILRRLSRVGLGGRMADGRQFVSWIHERDFCRAVEWILEHDSLEGPVNLAAPGPVSNAEMMRIFRRETGIPFGLPAARWMLELGAFVLRTETELLLKSRHVVPGRLLDSGFKFEFPTLDQAVRELHSRPRAQAG